MKLVRKHVTPRMLLANRANSRKSTGPRSKAGKRRAARNAGKYFVFGQVTPSRMEALGEDPWEFERLRQSLRAAVEPRDGFEEVLVEEMVVNRWRLARLRRAEMGILWRQRAELEAVKQGLERREASTDNLTVRAFGLAGTPDSPRKFLPLLDLLASLRELVRKEGFTPQGMELLRTIYGASPDAAGLVLIAKFKTGMPREDREPDLEEDDEALPPGAEDGQQAGVESESADTTGQEPEGDSPLTEEAPAQEAEARDSFLESLDHEVATFTRQGLVEALAQKAPLPEPMKDACLLASKDETESILRYETMLQREFVRAQKQLHDWRNRKFQASRERGGDGLH